MSQIFDRLLDMYPHYTVYIPINYPFDDVFPTISKCSTLFCFCWGVDCKCICSLLANFGGSGQSKKWERAIGCERIWEHHPHHPHHPRYLLLPSHHSGGFASFNLHPLGPLHSRWRRTNILKQEKIHEFHTRCSLKWPVDQWKIACWPTRNGDVMDARECQCPKKMMIKAPAPSKKSVHFHNGIDMNRWHFTGTFACHDHPPKTPYHSTPGCWYCLWGACQKYLGPGFALFEGKNDPKSHPVVGFANSVIFKMHLQFDLIIIDIIDGDLSNNWMQDNHDDKRSNSKWGLRQANMDQLLVWD